MRRSASASRAGLRYATHSAVLPRTGGLLHRPDDAQAEPREADVGHGAAALVRHRAAGLPRDPSSARPSPGRSDWRNGIVRGLPSGLLLSASDLPAARLRSGDGALIEGQRVETAAPQSTEGVWVPPTQHPVLLWDGWWQWTTWPRGVMTDIGKTETPDPLFASGQDVEGVLGPLAAYLYALEARIATLERRRSAVPLVTAADAARYARVNVATIVRAIRGGELSAAGCVGGSPRHPSRCRRRLVGHRITGGTGFFAAPPALRYEGKRGC